MGNFKLVNLLRWKKQVFLKGLNDKPILDEKNKPIFVWMRIIGDEAQQEAYKVARVKSSEKRLLLRDPETNDYKDQVLPIIDADRDICIQLIKASRGSNFNGEALANVERPNLPKLEEIAVDADAPTLEEQEKMDKAVADIEAAYEKALTDYVATRGAELEAELEKLSLDEIRVQAMFETSNALALGVFLTEVQIEKVWRSIFMDEACTVPGYEDGAEFRAQHTHIKEQLMKAYEELETPPEEVKN